MKMEKPTVEAVRFTSADVIATSGVKLHDTVTLAGFGNTSIANTFTIGGTTYGPSAANKDSLISALKIASGSNDGDPSFLWSNGGYYGDLHLSFLWDNDDNGEYGAANGVYTWYNGSNRSYWKWDSSN